MRCRILPVIVLVVATGLAAPNASLSSQQNLVGQISLRQKIQNDIFNLHRNLARTPDGQERATLIKKFEVEVVRARANFPRQAESDEIYFDQLTAVFREIPKSVSFSTTTCEELKSKLRAQFEPSAMGGKMRGSALQEGRRVVGRLCRG